MNHSSIRVCRLWAASGAALLCLSSASAQTPATTAPASEGAACIAPADVSAVHLYGLWQLSLWPLEPADAAPLSKGAALFERHPEYPGSVRGHLQRSTPGNDERALLSGDAVDGEFNLDESVDGVNMSAVWEGALSDCGREIRGLRRPAEGSPTTDPAMRFQLTKTPGWR